MQNFETGLYVNPAGTWTTAPERAQSFLNARQATEYKMRRRLASTFVVLVVGALLSRPTFLRPANLPGLVHALGTEPCTRCAANLRLPPTFRTAQTGAHCSESRKSWPR